MDCSCNVFSPAHRSNVQTDVKGGESQILGSVKALECDCGFWVDDSLVVEEFVEPAALRSPFSKDIESSKKKMTLQISGDGVRNLVLTPASHVTPLEACFDPQATSLFTEADVILRDLKESKRCSDRVRAFFGAVMSVCKRIQNRSGMNEKIEVPFTAITINFGSRSVVRK